MECLPREIHAIMASYAGNSKAGDWFRTLAGDAEDWNTVTDEKGAKRTQKNGLLHSRNGQPAVIEADGSRWWYRDGKLHRDNDQPAVILADGSLWWCRDNEWHRDNDKPAVMDAADGYRHWYRDGIEYKPRRKWKSLRFKNRPVKS